MTEPVLPHDSSPRDSTPRYSALWHLFLSRVREFYREPEAVFWVYVFPLLMVVSLGTAFRNQPVRQISVAIEASDGAESVREKLETPPPQSSGTYSPPVIQAGVHAAEKCRRLLRTGRADLLLRVRRTGDGTPPEYEYVYDPTRPESAPARQIVDDRLQRAAGRGDVLSPGDVAFEEPAGRYVDFLVPGLIGMSLMGGGLWGVGFVTVDMRIRKLLKRYLATPMLRSQFLASVVMSRMVFMVPEVLLVIVFARYMFGVRIQGAIWEVVLLVFLGSLMFAGIGLLIAARAKTIETVSGLINFITLPMWLLSGIFFSSSRFPEWLQPFVKLLPLTLLIDLLRGVMQNGVSMFVQWPELLGLITWAVLSSTIALKCFRWTEG
jgi:ABC-type multidrug transport system permease subunit